MRIIAGRWRGRRLKVLRGSRVRPTGDRVREAWMAVVAPVLADAVVADLFAGSGALGLEALSRGARRAVFVDISRASVRVIRANIALLNARECTRVVHGDALAYARRLKPGAVDLAFADPPYERGLAVRLLACYQHRPFATRLWVEHHSREAFPPFPGLRLRHREYGDTTLTLAEHFS